MPGDIEAMSRVLVDSITALCTADHHDDPARIAQWTQNKSPDGIREMLARPGFHMLVCLEGETIVGVGAWDEAGAVRLNYVAPDARFRGVSSALLASIETALREHGFEHARLETSRTAREFYAARGWQDDPHAGPNAMIKRL